MISKLNSKLIVLSLIISYTRWGWSWV